MMLPDRWSDLYGGYAAGLRGDPWPNDAPIGSWWAFGYRHGCVDRAARVT